MRVGRRSSLLHWELHQTGRNQNVAISLQCFDLSYNSDRMKKIGQSDIELGG